ncbi:putative membrane protein, partial [Escherichia coli 8.2524]
YIFLKKYYL